MLLIAPVIVEVDADVWYRHDPLPVLLIAVPPDFVMFTVVDPVGTTAYPDELHETVSFIVTVPAENTIRPVAEVLVHVTVPLMVTTAEALLFHTAFA